MMLNKPVFAILIFVYSSLTLSKPSQCPTLKQEAIESIKEQADYPELSQAFQLECQNDHSTEKYQLPRTYATKMFKKGSATRNKPQYDFPEKVLEYTSICYQQSSFDKELGQTDLAEGILYFSIKLHKNRVSSAVFKQKRRQHQASAEHAIETPLVDSTKQEEIPQPTPVDNTELGASFYDLYTTSPAPAAYLDLFLGPLEDIRPRKRLRHSNHFFEEIETSLAEQNMLDAESINSSAESINSSAVSTNENNTSTTIEELEKVLAKETVPTVFDDLY